MTSQPAMPPPTTRPSSTSYSKRILANAVSTTKPTGYTTAHHVGGSPPTSFTNPWPSPPPPHSLSSIIKAKFFNYSEKNFVPIPTDRSQLVQVRKPNWGAGDANSDSWTKLKATWVGHAGFVVEFPSLSPNKRGVRVMLDPVFSERMSPFSFLGPLRFTPTPCSLDELPEVDAVCISHNHYDHLDAATIRFINQRGNGRVKFLCALGVAEDFVGMGVSVEDIAEMDWWDGTEIVVEEDGVLLGHVRIICTPCQHISGRWINDHGKTLWCSYVLQQITPRKGKSKTETISLAEKNTENVGKTLFFAGDTAYRAIPKGATEEEIARLPVCPAFGNVGEIYGPFDLALVPIGCYMPRWWMSAVHCAPEDSICIHRDVKSRRSIGMHYGTIRGGISQAYEPVTEPPRRWRESCEKAGLQWQKEIGIIDIGETALA